MQISFDITDIVLAVVAASLPVVRMYFLQVWCWLLIKKIKTVAG